jgi:hypothetical protein
LTPCGEEERVDDKRKDALDGIDFEIARIEATERDEGWTTWALAAAIASLLWLAFDHATATSSSASFEDVGYLLVMCLLALSTWRFFGAWLGRQYWSNDRDSEPVVQPPQWLPAQRGSVLLSGATSAFVLFVVLMTPAPLSRLGWWWILVLHSLLVAFAAAGFVATFVGLPTVLEKPKVAPLSVAIGLCMGLVGLLGPALHAIGGYLTNAERFSAQELRVAVLLACAGALLSFLLDRTGSKLTREELTRIRRELMYGRLEPDSARRHAEIAVLGATPSGLLSDVNGPILSRLGAMRRDQHELVARATGLAEKLEKGVIAAADSQSMVAEIVIQFRDFGRRVADEMTALEPEHATADKLHKKLRYGGEEAREASTRAKALVRAELEALVDAAKATRNGLDRLIDAHQASDSKSGREGSGSVPVRVPATTSEHLSAANGTQRDG